MRSEGGAECRKIQEEMTTSSGTESAKDLPGTAMDGGGATHADGMGAAPMMGGKGKPESVEASES